MCTFEIQLLSDAAHTYAQEESEEVCANFSSFLVSKKRVVRWSFCHLHE